MTRDLFWPSLFVIVAAIFFYVAHVEPIIDARKFIVEAPQ